MAIFTQITKLIGQLGYDNQVKDALNQLSLLDETGLVWKGEFTPTIGQEYPSTPSFGWSYTIKIASPYTFTTGDLIGETVSNGIIIAFSTIWVIGTTTDAVTLQGYTPLTLPISTATSNALALKEDIADNDVKLALKADITYVNNKPTGFKNLLINSNGLINQRNYVSGTATTTANEYTIDMFKVITLGESLVFSTTANKTTFTAPLNGVEQIIEGKNVQSGTHVISGLLTATCTIDGVAKVNGDTVTLTGGTNVSVKWFNGTFSLPQLEQGDVITPPENRHISLEFDMCQRYLPRAKVRNNYFYSGMAFSTSVMYVNIPFAVTARTAPTGILTSDANIRFSAQNGTSLGTGIAFASALDTSCSVSAVGVTTAVLGQATMLTSSTGSGGTTILFTGCEL
jgi:hypothetical protein